MTPRQTRPRLKLLLPALVFAGVLVFAWWAYGPGTSGGWHFDDHANLNGLEQVEDLTSGLIFTTSGFAGPLKRPVALASFALQAQSWPDHPENFLRVNVFIHLFNGVLVFWLAGLLAGFVADKTEQGRRRGFALAVAAAWVLSPFLASASLMAVQRMTLLAATFMFAGLGGYLLGRRRMATRPRSGLLLALFSLGAGTLVAAFAKENGALLPILVLLCEFLVIRRAKTALPPLPRSIFHLLLTLPTLLILGYLTWRGITGAGYTSRDFDVGQRLLTQARVVWDYLFALLAPRAATVTPYSDGWQASQSLLSPLSTLFAVLGLGALFAAMLAGARRWPLMVFGLAWFFAAQLLESTTVALELYFAHRVYVSAFGLFFALAWPLFFSPAFKNIRWAGPLLATVFSAASGLVLLYAAWLWGQPDKAAQVWYEKNPNSVRAAQKISFLYARKGSARLADDVLAKALEIRPGHQMLTLQRMNYCGANLNEGKHDAQKRLESAQLALTAPKTVTLAAAIQLHDFVLGGFSHCNAFSVKDLNDLIRTTLHDSSRHQSRRTTEYIHYALAQLAERGSQPAIMRKHLEQALALEPDPQTAILVAYAYILDGDLPAARDYLRRSLAQPPPMNRLERALWNKQIGQYLRDISD